MGRPRAVAVLLPVSPSLALAAAADCWAAAAAAAACARRRRAAAAMLALLPPPPFPTTAMLACLVHNARCARNLLAHRAVTSLSTADQRSKGRDGSSMAASQAVSSALAARVLSRPSARLAWKWRLSEVASLTRSSSSGVPLGRRRLRAAGGAAAEAAEAAAAVAARAAESACLRARPACACSVPVEEILLAMLREKEEEAEEAAEGRASESRAPPLLRQSSPTLRPQTTARRGGFPMCRCRCPLQSQRRRRPRPRAAWRREGRRRRSGPQPRCQWSLRRRPSWAQTSRARPGRPRRRRKKRVDRKKKEEQGQRRRRLRGRPRRSHSMKKADRSRTPRRRSCAWSKGERSGATMSGR